MDASDRGRLLNKLADLIERDQAYLAVSSAFSKNDCLWETHMFFQTEISPISSFTTINLILLQKKVLLDVLKCTHGHMVKYAVSCFRANNFPASIGKLSHQTDICMGMSHIWPDNYVYRYKKLPPPSHDVNFQSIYCTWASISMHMDTWYSEISITFFRTTTASNLHLIYG